MYTVKKNNWIVTFSIIILSAFMSACQSGVTKQADIQDVSMIGDRVVYLDSPGVTLAQENALAVLKLKRYGYDAQETPAGVAIKFNKNESTPVNSFCDNVAQKIARLDDLLNRYYLSERNVLVTSGQGRGNEVGDELLSACADNATRALMTSGVSQQRVSSFWYGAKGQIIYGFDENIDVLGDDSSVILLIANPNTEERTPSNTTIR